jgi:hypothetical protein
VRYFVRDAEGKDLVCPSLADLHALYRGGFFGEEDLVRAERSERWVRAGSFPALRGVREQRRDPRKMALLLLAALVMVLALAILARTYLPALP